VRYDQVSEWLMVSKGVVTDLVTDLECVHVAGGKSRLITSPVLREVEVVCRFPRHLRAFALRARNL